MRAVKGVGVRGIKIVFTVHAQCYKPYLLGKGFRERTKRANILFDLERCFKSGDVKIRCRQIPYVDLNNNPKNKYQQISSMPPNTNTRPA